MRIHKLKFSHKLAVGFTLPVVLIVVSALLILAIGMLLISGIERKTARSFTNRERAKLAAQSGLIDVSEILAQETTNDQYVILQSFLTKSDPIDHQPSSHLFVARGEIYAGKLKFNYTPLFSYLSGTNVPPTPVIASPEVAPLLGSAPNIYTNFQTLPFQDQVRVAWLPIMNRNNQMVARYAYWVEDLQSRVDASIAGNQNASGRHARSAWPFPAAGLNDHATGLDQPDLNQIALYAVDPTATDENQKSLGTELIENRNILISPDSTLPAAGISSPLARLTGIQSDASTAFMGELADPQARAVEESLYAKVQPYAELALVPFADGIDPKMAGGPKLNLNKMLSTDRDFAINQMADLIKKALPDFEGSVAKPGRKGGFTEDYLKTLAANALDYADSDSEPSVMAGSYRGLDAYPLVSEFLLKVRWENVRIANGRKFVDLAVSTYVELWNMSNLPVKGNAEVTYETKYQFKVPPSSNVYVLNDLSNATHNLTQNNGYYWYPPINVNLRPNEYHVYKCGTVKVSFDVASASEVVPPSLKLYGENSGQSGAGYRLRWNGQLIDQSGGGIDRNDMTINYPKDTKTEPRQGIKFSVPGHSYDRTYYIYNMGDPRMAAYIQAPQAPYEYPQNFSPNRRSIRLGSIYADNNDKISGRVLLSEWPDGGHDSSYGVDTLYGLLGMTRAAFDNEYRIDPDDPRFSNSLPDLSHGAAEAPMRLSNSGRFYSVTELGNIYDPIMWRVRTSADFVNVPGRPWGDVSSSSLSSSDHGGGNTLRIGRPEHPAFDRAGLRASQLLDLFHVGRSRSENRADREGGLIDIIGKVNINTASKAALRLLIAGRLQQDPEIRKFLDDNHTGDNSKFPSVIRISPAPDVTEIADRIAAAVIASRPYAGTAELANAKEADGTAVFGNPQLFTDYSATSASFTPRLQWTDAAAEESFARAYEASTVRSRNFRVWVVGQSVTPTSSANETPEVLAENRRAYTIFANPGTRKDDGSIDPEKFKIDQLYENEF